MIHLFISFICLAMTSTSLFADEEVNCPEQFDMDFADDNSTTFFNDCQDCCDCQQDWDLWSLDDYLYVGYTGGNGLGYRGGYATTGIFLTAPSFENSSFVPFLDGRAHVFNHGKWAANAGLGLRYILSSWNAVIGANVYYDYRRYRHYDYNQIGIGLEWLSQWFDFRVNGYLPVDSDRKKGKLFNFGDNLFAVRFKHQQAFRGIDAELGIWILDKTPCNWFGLYVAAGPYFYSREHKDGSRHRSINGGQGRILAKINDYVDLTVSGSYDNYYHGLVQGQINLYLPLDGILGIFSNDCCCCKSSPCLDRQIAYQPVERNPIIVTRPPQACWQWNWSGACPCSGSCDDGYSCPSGSSGSCSGSGSSVGYTSRSWNSDDFSSDFFRFPRDCSYNSSSSGSTSYSSFSRSGYSSSNSLR